ncbi:MAG: DnaB-like helicase C-terminal domain-containing protein [Acidimicrobiales bacterium]
MSKHMSLQSGTTQMPHVGTLLEALASSSTQPLDLQGTGFDPLDLALDGGFNSEELVLVGGRPGVGKTVMMTQLARTAALAGRRAVYVSYEHSERAMLSRLLTLELAENSDDLDATMLLTLRRLIRSYCFGSTTDEEFRAHHPRLSVSADRLASLGERLQIVAASHRTTDLEVISQLASAALSTGDILLIDYLQKIPAPVTTDRGPTFEVAEVLKDLANELGVTVVVAAAVTDAGISRGRIRLDHLEGRAALAHECDIALILNEKVKATSPVHLAYDTTRIDEARNQVVMSVEKNRRGPTDINMEFTKDFANFRFHPNGSFVSDTLMDDIPSEEHS